MRHVFASFAGALAGAAFILTTWPIQDAGDVIDVPGTSYDRCVASAGRDGWAPDLCEGILAPAMADPEPWMDVEEDGFRISFETGQWVKIHDDGSVTAGNPGEQSLWTWDGVSDA